MAESGLTTRQPRRDGRIKREHTERGLHDLNTRCPGRDFRIEFVLATMMSAEREYIESNVAYELRP